MSCNISIIANSTWRYYSTRVSWCVKIRLISSTSCTTWTICWNYITCRTAVIAYDACFEGRCGLVVAHRAVRVAHIVQVVEAQSAGCAVVDGVLAGAACDVAGGADMGGRVWKCACGAGSASNTGKAIQKWLISAWCYTGCAVSWNYIACSTIAVAYDACFEGRCGLVVAHRAVRVAHIVQVVEAQSAGCAVVDGVLAGAACDVAGGADMGGRVWKCACGAGSASNTGKAIQKWLVWSSCCTRTTIW